MKTIVKRLLIIGAVIMVVVGLLLSALVYAVEFRKWEVYRETAPDQSHVLVIYQVGEADWPFGSATTQVQVRNANNKIINKKELEVGTDGGMLNAYYIEQISWEEHSVTVSFSGEIDDAVCELDF